MRGRRSFRMIDTTEFWLFVVWYGVLVACWYLARERG